MAEKAIFLDRDGTIVDDPGYLADPAKLKLLGGVDLAIKSLRQAGYRIVVVTNQSGVARGMLTEATLKAIHDKMADLLAGKGAPIDAIYHCPYHPEGSVEPFAKDSDLRKPAPGMLTRAAEKLDLDLQRSWMVGDAARDVQAGVNAGCRTVLIDGGDDKHEPDAPCDHRARNLVEAARIILRAGEPQQTPQTPTPTPEPAPAPHPAPQPTSSAPEPESASDPEDPAASADTQEDPAVESEPTAEEPPAATVEKTPTEAPPAPTGTAPAGPSSVPAPASPAEDDENARVRKEILMHVRQLVRSEETDEFHLTHVLGGVAQVLVGLFLLLVFYKALAANDAQAALLWAVVAVVFQTMSLTFFIMARNKH